MIRIYPNNLDATYDEIKREKNHRLSVQNLCEKQDDAICNNFEYIKALEDTVELFKIEYDRSHNMDLEERIVELEGQYEDVETQNAELVHDALALQNKITTLQQQIEKLKEKQNAKRKKTKK